MNSDNTTPVGIVATGIQTVLAISQANEIFQTIQIILSCLTFAVTLAYTIYKWYKNAKKDGKIDKDEIEDLADIFKDSIDEIKETKIFDNDKKENK